MIENLATATPFEVDSELERLDGEYFQLRASWDATIERVHHQLDERKVSHGRRRVWPTSWQEAVEALQVKVDANDFQMGYQRASAAEVLDRLPKLSDQMKANREEAAIYDSEYNRRPWTRFFLVISFDGHIHRNTLCSSYPRTKHGWQPKLSGKTEAEAVKKLGPRMCTKCFPSAPVEWTRGVEKPVDPNKCSGQGQFGLNIQWRVSPWGTCPTCKTRASVSKLGKMLKHDKPKDNAGK
jgi:hypothetical protein